MAFGISFPDYPGCISGGNDLAEALERGRAALAFHLQGMAEDGEEIGKPSEAKVALKAAADEIRDGALPSLLEVDFRAALYR
jgi:predicted RNase H-like HicB family nuclease